MEIIEPIYFLNENLYELVQHYEDRKSTRLNSSHSQISYAVFCLKNTRNSLNPCTQYVHCRSTSLRCSSSCRRPWQNSLGSGMSSTMIPTLCIPYTRSKHHTSDLQ